MTEERLPEWVGRIESVSWVVHGMEQALPIRYAYSITWAFVQLRLPGLLSACISGYREVGLVWSLRVALRGRRQSVGSPWPLVC